MAAVEQAFAQAFGPYCGWAHNTLFISELASQKHRLPVRLGGLLTSASADPTETDISTRQLEPGSTLPPAVLPTAHRTASEVTEATDVDPTMQLAAAAESRAVEKHATGKRKRSARASRAAKPKASSDVIPSKGRGDRKHV